MNFTYDKSGSPQQQQWAQQAVGFCTYPLDLLKVDVNVKWSATIPTNVSGHIHPYMVTIPLGAGIFEIWVDSRANDPTWKGVHGLPDATDLQGFYMSSFVHEIGHVVAMSTFNLDGDDTLPAVTEMCKLFWTNHVIPPIKREGDKPDWSGSSLNWANEICEAVAEVFRITFYDGGTFSFGNRTNWNIDNA